MTTNTEQLLSELASEALLTLDGIADTNPRDRADFENKDEWITWAKSRAKWAADKLRAPISRELLAERVLKQTLEQDAALTQPAQAGEIVPWRNLVAAAVDPDAGHIQYFLGSWNSEHIKAGMVWASATLPAPKV